MSLFASLTDAAYALVRPIVHASDGEAAHNLTIAALETLPRARVALTSPILRTEVAGLSFPNPVGLAPGFDKDARAAAVMPRFGFGFVEVGTLTPLPQEGNPRPRLFRLVEDGAVINRMGFNNGGQAAAMERIAKLRACGMAVPLGINIGANKDSDDRIADYARGTAAMAPLADYLTVNISSPNTPGLRALQDKGALEALLDAVDAAQPLGAAKPVFLKVAPDLEPADIDDVVAVALDKGLAALIVSNTTIGLAGAALAPRARGGRAVGRAASRPRASAAQGFSQRERRADSAHWRRRHRQRRTGVEAHPRGGEPRANLFGNGLRRSRPCRADRARARGSGGARRLHARRRCGRGGRLTGCAILPRTPMSRG